MPAPTHNHIKTTENLARLLCDSGIHAPDLTYTSGSSTSIYLEWHWYPWELSIIVAPSTIAGTTIEFRERHLTRNLYSHTLYTPSYKTGQALITRMRELQPVRDHQKD